MNVASHLALAIYSGVTAPGRARRLARWRRAGRLPVCVLFYHRVADWCPNDWTMSNRMFQQQIAWLQANFDLVSLAEAQERIAAGRNDRPTACVTFDDGYADNFDYALPLLLRERVPFTYFVASDHVLQGRSFPHDAAAGYPLRPNKPDEIELLASLGVEIGAHTRSHASLGPAASRAQLEHEVLGSKRDLEDLIGRQVRYFAFPFGLPEHMSQEAFRVAYAAGYDGVCSAYGAYNFPGGDAFHIRRIHGDGEFVRLKNWLTLDGRKVRKQDRFDPGDYRQSDAAEEFREEERLLVSSTCS